VNKKELTTGIVAGIIAFIWGWISWMALPWHAASFEKLKGEPVAVQAIKLAAPESGMYAYPGMDATKEEMKKTPHLLVAINYAEKKLPICLTIGLLIHVLGGLVLTCLLKKSNVTTLGDRMKIVCKAIFFVGFVGVLPNWLWWGFTPFYTFLVFMDLLMGWGAAGFWIAKRI